MILFLDNIRGFNRQFIEINDVNFLIGENSTGKTTVMSILSLLSDENFLRTGTFKNQFVDFGPFKEIINQGSKNDKTFAIGVIESSGWHINNSKISLLLIYDESEGFPRLRQFYYSANDSLIKFSLEFIKVKNHESMKIVKYSDPIVLLEGRADIRELFVNWENEQFKVTSWHEDAVFSTFWDQPLYLLYLVSKFGEKKYTEFDSVSSNFGNKALDHETTWIDPIRSKPQRVYEPQKNDYSAEGAHTPSLLRNIFSTPKNPDSKKIIKTIHDFGKASGLFDEIVIDSYRKTIESPFELHLKLRGKELKISNIGYGISQMLPIITEIALRNADAFFLIQQPEVHLHPRSQAFFGQFFFEQFNKRKKFFIIETHSDFILDRFRLMVRKSRKKDIHTKVNFLFFESTEDGNKVTKISIDKNGDYSPEQPEKFRDFFLKEEMALLGF